MEAICSLKRRILLEPHSEISQKIFVIDWACLRTGCWENYLHKRGMEWREGGENHITRSCVICTLHQI
jgi:predicted NBD/HSP70 family sugar kinase